MRRKLKRFSSGTVTPTLRTAALMGFQRNHRDIKVPAAVVVVGQYVVSDIMNQIVTSNDAKDVNYDMVRVSLDRLLRMSGLSKEKMEQLLGDKTSDEVIQLSKALLSKDDLAAISQKKKADVNEKQDEASDDNEIATSYDVPLAMNLLASSFTRSVTDYLTKSGIAPSFRRLLFEELVDGELILALPSDWTNILDVKACLEYCQSWHAALTLKDSVEALSSLVDTFSSSPLYKLVRTLYKVHVMTPNEKVNVSKEYMMNTFRSAVRGEAYITQSWPVTGIVSTVSFTDSVRKSFPQEVKDVDLLMTYAGSLFMLNALPFDSLIKKRVDIKTLVEAVEMHSGVTAPALIAEIMSMGNSEGEMDADLYCEIFLHNLFSCLLGGTLELTANVSVFDRKIDDMRLKPSDEGGPMNQFKQANRILSLIYDSHIMTVRCLQSIVKADIHYSKPTVHPRFREKMFTAVLAILEQDVAVKMSSEQPAYLSDYGHNFSTPGAFSQPQSKPFSLDLSVPDFMVVDDFRKDLKFIEVMTIGADLAKAAHVKLCMVRNSYNSAHASLLDAPVAIPLEFINEANVAQAGFYTFFEKIYRTVDISELAEFRHAMSFVTDAQLSQAGLLSEFMTMLGSEVSYIQDHYDYAHFFNRPLNMAQKEFEKPGMYIRNPDWVKSYFRMFDPADVQWFEVLHAGEDRFFTTPFVAQYPFMTRTDEYVEPVQLTFTNQMTKSKKEALDMFGVDIVTEAKEKEKENDKV